MIDDQTEEQTSTGIENVDSIKKNWIDEMIERESVPQPLRNETVEVFAKRNGMSVANYYYHCSKPENQKRILELSLNIAKREVPEILKVLIENAKAGKEKSIEMYLDYVIKLAKNLDIKSDGKQITPIYAGKSDISISGQQSNEEDISAEEEN